VDASESLAWSGMARRFVWLALAIIALFVVVLVAFGSRLGG
jgi:hypothetical protein